MSYAEHFRVRPQIRALYRTILYNKTIMRYCKGMRAFLPLDLSTVMPYLISTHRRCNVQLVRSYVQDVIPFEYPAEY